MKKKSVAITITVVASLLFAFVLFNLYKYLDMYHRIYEPIANQQQSEVYVPDPTPDDQEKDHVDPFTLLILGIDARGKAVTRSDTMILSAVNPYTQKITLLSIPRDTLAKIPDHGNDKINHAMVYGGASLSKATLENFLDIPIDHYVTVDFASFRKIVDAVGGIEIDVKKRMRYYDPTDGTDINLYPGLQVLDGKNALDYARYRKSSIGTGDSDFERMARQHEVIKAIIDKAKDNISIGMIYDLMDIVGEHLRTDLTHKQMLDLYKTFKDFSSDKIDELSLEGEGKKLPYGEYELYFYVVSDEEKARVKGLLEDALAVPETYQ